MPTVAERRSSLRLSIPLPMEIEKAAGEPGVRFKIEVVLSNIGAGGAYFETDHWQLFDVGTNVQVTVHLPQSAACEALGYPRLRSSAMVTRTQPAAISRAEGGSIEQRGVAVEFDNPLSFI